MCQPCIPRDQGCSKHFSECDVGRVVGGNVLPKIPDAFEERGMRVADEPRFAEPVQGQPRPCRRESAAKVVASQGMKHLDLEEVRHVQGLVRLRNPLADAPGFRTNVQQDGDCSRRIEDDQGPLIKIAGIVGIAHPTDGNFRGLVQLNRLVAR